MWLFVVVVGGRVCLGFVFNVWVGVVFCSLLMLLIVLIDWCGRVLWLWCGGAPLCNAVVVLIGFGLWRVSFLYCYDVCVVYVCVRIVVFCALLLSCLVGCFDSTNYVSPQMREQWLQYMQDRRLLRGTLIVFKEWLASKAVIHENLLVQTNQSFDRNKFQSRDKPKTSTSATNAEVSSKSKNFACPFKDRQHQIWSKKFKSLKETERREHVQKFRLCFICLKPGHMSKDCRNRTCNVPSCGRRHHRLLRSGLPKKDTTKNVSDATTAVATNITQEDSQWYESSWQTET